MMFKFVSSTVKIWVSCFALLVIVVLLLFMVFMPEFVNLGGPDFPGHLQPLGNHRKPEGGIDVLDEFPHPKDFFTNYVMQSKPALFKGLAKGIPAYSLWNDQYLSTKFGDVPVSVETGKKENRENPMLNLNMKEFIERYQKENVYMVHDILSFKNAVEGMINELALPRCLQCGNFQKLVTNVIMWFSSGGTNSVLHTDSLDNINCIFSGTKQLFMVDKRHGVHKKFDRPGAHSGVNVESVDMIRYPELRDVPWYNVTMETGDCLYIPYLWGHNVKSSHSRNMAVNFWMAHVRFFNETDCEDKDLKAFLPLQEIGKLDTREMFFQDLITSIEDFDIRNETQFVKFMTTAMSENLGQNVDAQKFSNVFVKLDMNKDGNLTREEILTCDKALFDSFIVLDNLGAGYTKDEL